MSNEKNAELTVYAENRYVYNMDDLSTFRTYCSTGEGQVTTFKGGQREVSIYGSTLNKEAAERAGIRVDGTEVTAAFPEITVEKAGNTVQVAFGEYGISASSRHDRMHISKEAAPTKMTFKPTAVKYEINKDDFAKFGNTLQSMYSPDIVYRVVTNSKPGYELGNLSNDSLLGMFGCTPTRDGGASVKEKSISVYKLANGFSVKLGKNVLFVITVAEPTFKVNDEVNARVLNEAGDGWDTFKTNIKHVNGFNSDDKDFTYEVTDAAGNVVIVPERNIFEYAFKQEPVDSTDGVKMNHF